MKRVYAINLAEEISRVVATFPRYHKIITEYNKIVGEEYDSLENNGIKWHEILVFGSVAKKCDNEKVGDLDMILIDNGVISSRYEHYKIDNNGGEDKDLYRRLKSNLNDLLESEIGCHNRNVNDLLGRLEEERPIIDLHILPLKLFKNKKYRKEVLSKHKDPNFFKNCFDSMLRLRMGKQFVPVSVSYFEHKYKCDLRDMKR